MNEVIKHSIRFIILWAIQTLVLNQLDIGFGIQMMVYPLFIMLLPIDLGIFFVMILAFALGAAIDSISDTYGLHTSSLLIVAYFRPIIFKMFAPRDGYENFREGNIYELGTRWFIYVYGLLLLIHHFWFFTLEIFRLDNILFILIKTAISVPLSFILSLLLQTMLVSKPKER